MPTRLPSVVALLAAVLLLGACSSGSAPGPSTAPSPPPVATAIVGSALADPVPVPATDGRTHLVYELQLTNTLGGNATLKSLTVSAGDRKLLTLSGENLKYWTRTLDNPTTPTAVLGPGQTALVWLDVAIDGGAEVPAEVSHSVDLTVAKPVPGLIEANVTQNVAPVRVSDRKPVSIVPPLDGSNWLDANGCCGMSAHRMAANPINGKLYVAERFAIDYVQLGNDYRLLRGDPTKPESYPYLGAAIHAVGNGTVVSVRDDLPEQIPTKPPSGLPLDQYAGNHIVEDLGDGNYALYAHLKPGSVTVKPGDELKTGQSIAALGNSGNTTAPHLHFHVIDGPDPLAANGLPFVISSFRLDQRVASDDALDQIFTGRPAELQRGFAARDVSQTMPLDRDVMKYSVGQ